MNIKGPLQGLLDELEYNLIISRDLSLSTLGFQSHDAQMSRAIREGVLSILHDDLEVAISTAYGSVSRANESSRSWVNSHEHHGPDYKGANEKTLAEVKFAIPLIQEARDKLFGFVQSETNETDNE